MDRSVPYWKDVKPIFIFIFIKLFHIQVNITTNLYVSKLK